MRKERATFFEVGKGTCQGPARQAQSRRAANQPITTSSCRKAEESEAAVEEVLRVEKHSIIYVPSPYTLVRGHTETCRGDPVLAVGAHNGISSVHATMSSRASRGSCSPMPCFFQVGSSMQ
jgi:hypothetical protein